jgi:hypothetical protein
MRPPGERPFQPLRGNLRRNYPANTVESSLSMVQSLKECSTKCSDVEFPLRKELQPRNQHLVSDINGCFDIPVVNINDMKDPNWLCNWWRIDKDEYPRTAAAARDYLAILVSELQQKGYTI